MTQTQTNGPSPPPPPSPRRPHTFTTHGITVTRRLRVAEGRNWQEVLRDPSLLDADIRNYLEAENGYTESLLGHTSRLQKTLVKEMRGRIKEDDLSVPSPDGPFAYFRKFREGGQHEIFGRTPRDGGEEIVLDGDELAARPRLFHFRRRAAFARSQARAWSADIKGSEYFTIRVRDWATASTATTWSRRPTAAWSGARTARASSMSSSTTITARCRSGVIASAPRKPTIALVYEEQDAGWFTHLHESSSGRFCVIAGGDHETSEQRLIDLADPEAPPRLVAAREEGVQYSVDDRGDELFILTNADGAIDFKIVTAPLASPERANWRDLIPYREASMSSMSSSMPATGAAGARECAAVDHHPRPHDRRRTRDRLRRSGLLARHHGRLRVRHHESAVHLFVDDDAVGDL